MPLSPQQLRNLEAALQREANERLTERGWNGARFNVLQPYTSYQVWDDLGLRLTAHATVSHEHRISAQEIERMGEQAGNIFRESLDRLVSSYPALPGSPVAIQEASERELAQYPRVDAALQRAARLHAAIREGAWVPAPEPPRTISVDWDEPKKPAPPPPPEPEPVSRWERLVGDDLV